MSKLNFYFGEMLVPARSVEISETRIEVRADVDRIKMQRLAECVGNTAGTSLECLLHFGDTTLQHMGIRFYDGKYGLDLSFSRGND